MKLGIELIRNRCIVGVGAQHRVELIDQWKYTVSMYVRVCFSLFFPFSLVQIFLRKSKIKLTLKINQTKFQIENEMRNRPSK